jgi:hypothetical protein
VFHINLLEKIILLFASYFSCLKFLANIDLKKIEDKNCVFSQLKMASKKHTLMVNFLVEINTYELAAGAVL